MAEYKQTSAGNADTETFFESLYHTGGEYNSFNSLEQFVTPIQIQKSHPAEGPTPGFRNPANFDVGETGNFGRGRFVGPTIDELDPYFSTVFGDDGSEFFSLNDFVEVYSDAKDSKNRPQLNLGSYELVDGGDKRNITAVRTTAALRGPLIMSGWGFGVDDTPVPKRGENFPDNTNFHGETAINRDLWKTGPVHLAWDDERQVWSGGPRVVCGFVQGGIPKGDICTPPTFNVQVFRNTQNGHKLTDDLGEMIKVSNRDVSLEEDDVNNQIFCIAIKVNYEWLPIWVGCPDTPACGNDDQPAVPPCIKNNNCPPI